MKEIKFPVFLKERRVNTNCILVPYFMVHRMEQEDYCYSNGGKNNPININGINYHYMTKNYGQQIGS